MWEKLQSFNANSMTIEEMVVLLSHGKIYQSEFESQLIPAPEFLSMALRSLRRAIKAKRQDELEAEKSALMSRREAGATAEEKRAKMDARLAEIDKQLQEV